MAVTWEFWNFIVFLKIAFFSTCGVWIFIIIIIILHLNVEYRYFFTGHWKTFGLGVFIFWLFFPLLAVPSSFFPSAYFSTAWACSASLTNHILFFLKSYTRTVSSPWNSVLLILWLTVIHLSAKFFFSFFFFRVVFLILCLDWVTSVKLLKSTLFFIAFLTVSF